MALYSTSGDPGTSQTNSQESAADEPPRRTLPPTSPPTTRPGRKQLNATRIRRPRIDPARLPTDDANACGDRVAAEPRSPFSAGSCAVRTKCRSLLSPPTYARIASVSIARSGAPACLLGEILWEWGRGAKISRSEETPTTDRRARNSSGRGPSATADDWAECRLRSGTATSSGSYLSNLFMISDKGVVASTASTSIGSSDTSA
jgi:hypothetical protein